MPKVIKKRVQKRDLPTEEDLKEKLSNIKETIRRRQKRLLIFTVAILVVFISTLSFFLYSHNLQKKSEAFEYEAYKIFHNITNAKFENQQEQYKKALELFKKAYNTKKSPTSLFYIAACYYELGSYDDSLKTLKDFLKRYSDKKSLTPLAYQKMSMIYIKKNNSEEAIKTLDNLYKSENAIYKDFALMEYGKVLERMGKHQEANQKYKELIEKFPNSPFSEEAKIKLLPKEKQG